ncbi:MAG: aldo/keto reductase [Oscillospiraceae bacterium]
MEKRIFKKTGEKISLLGLGCMRLPKLYEDKEDIDYEKAQQLINYAYEKGINYYDTAFMYHNFGSEKFVGEAMKNFDRKTFFLASKMPLWDVTDESQLEEIFNKQLSNCQTEYFDFYLFHSATKELYKKFKQYNVYDFMKKKQAEGKIKHIGFSFHDDTSLISQMCDEYQWDFAQLQINYIDWEEQDAKTHYQILCDNNIPCIVMEPVRGGLLASPCEKSNKIFKDAQPEKSIASWAIRYVASLENVLTVLSGMSNMEQIEDNIKTMEDFKPLTKNEYEIINNALIAYKDKDRILCTACRYCMDCKFGVDIPEVFSQYNNYVTDKDSVKFKLEYSQKLEHCGADKCTECGQCEKHCPQAILIREKLKQINTFYKQL